MADVVPMFPCKECEMFSPEVQKQITHFKQYNPMKPAKYGHMHIPQQLRYASRIPRGLEINRSIVQTLLIMNQTLVADLS